jgi:hypothetical protein
MKRGVDKTTASHRAASQGRRIELGLISCEKGKPFVQSPLPQYWYRAKFRITLNRRRLGSTNGIIPSFASATDLPVQERGSIPPSQSYSKLHTHAQKHRIIPMRPSGAFTKSAAPRFRADASVVRTQRCGATTSTSSPERDQSSGAVLTRHGRSYLVCYSFLLLTKERETCS